MPYLYEYKYIRRCLYCITVPYIYDQLKQEESKNTRKRGSEWREGWVNRRERVRVCVCVCVCVRACVRKREGNTFVPYCFLF